jgi:CspA family cold shock protein
VRSSGKIKLFKDREGYGFIIPDDGSVDVFLHIQTCKRGGIEAPAGGMRVQYEWVQMRQRGRRATWVLELPE